MIKYNYIINDTKIYEDEMNIFKMFKIILDYEDNYKENSFYNKYNKNYKGNFLAFYNYIEFKDIIKLLNKYEVKINFLYIKGELIKLIKLIKNENIDIENYIYLHYLSNFDINISDYELKLTVSNMIALKFLFSLLSSSYGLYILNNKFKKKQYGKYYLYHDKKINKNYNVWINTKKNINNNDIIIFICVFNGTYGKKGNNNNIIRLLLLENEYMNY